MIIVKLEGGLGNQLFQIALYFRLCQLYGIDNVLVDSSNYNSNSPHNGYELDYIFHLSENGLINLATKSDLQKCIGSMLIGKSHWTFNRIKKVINKLNMRKKEHEGLKIYSEEMFSNILDLNERYSSVKEIINKLDINANYYFDGTWVGQSVFANNEYELESIVKKLKFPELNNRNDVALFSKIVNFNSVAIHIRCGDYIGSEFDIDMDNYYIKAIEFVKEKIENPFFLIFSDDIKGAKEKYPWMRDMIFVEGHSGRESYRDMQLMSYCRANIIANSTFSIWASYFNTRKDNLIIYPSHFKKNILMANILRDNAYRISN